MDAYTFQPISHDVAQQVYDRAQIILRVNYPNADRGTTKGVADNAVIDFIRTGEPVAHAQIPSPADPPYAPLTRFVNDLGAEHQRIARTRQVNAIVHRTAHKNVPTRQENHDHVDIENRYRLQEHVAAGHLAAAAGLLTIRDRNYKPELQKAIAESLEEAEASARQDTSQIKSQPTTVAPSQVSQPSRNTIEPSSRQFQLFDKTGLVAPRP